MSETIKDLRALTIEQLIEAHDQVALHTTVGVTYYLDELSRRENERRTRTIEGLTWAIFAFTAVVAGATVLLLLRG